MRIVVSGWLGSTNLGDELVFAGVRSLLRDAQVCAVSVDPEATARAHGVAAVDHRRVDLVARVTRQADLVVVGGGGLIQDETSPFNLPYHLSRAWLARLGSTPWVGVALGVGPLRTAAGRQLARTLSAAHGVTVRDLTSLELLGSLGVEAELAADAAFHLPSPSRPHVEVEPGRAGRQPAIVAALRPWSGGGGWLPVGWRPTRGRGGGEPDWFVPTVAQALERASRASGLPVRFVALQTDRDHALHRRVAAAMGTPTELVVPTRHSVLDELASGAVVVAMRYHAGIGATLAGRPSVLIGYSPKVDALAASLGDGARRLPFDRDALAGLDTAVLAQLESATAVAAVTAGAEELRQRATVNTRMLDRVLA